MSDLDHSVNKPLTLSERLWCEFPCVVMSVLRMAGVIDGMSQGKTDSVLNVRWGGMKCVP